MGAFPHSPPMIKSSPPPPNTNDNKRATNRQRTLKAATVSTTAPAFYEVGEAVWSERFGSGQIVAYDPEHDQGALLEVRFESGELRKLLARYARLERVS